RGDSDVDARADVFSLGCVLYECLTGQPAFQGRHAVAVLTKVLFEEPPRPRDLAPQVPAVVDSLVARMLSKLPEARPPDEIVSKELGAVGTDTPPASTDHPTSASRSRPPLGVAEWRLVSFVIASPVRDTHLEVQTLTPEQLLSHDAALAAEMESIGGRM